MSGFSPSTLGRGQSAVALSHTGDTNESTLATITIPAGSMGPNGRVSGKVSLSWTNSANNKTAKLKLAGVTLDTYGPLASSTGLMLEFEIANRGATNSQHWIVRESRSNSSTTWVQGTATADTTGNIDITITGTLALGTETITVEDYQFIVYPA